MRDHVVFHVLPGRDGWDVTKEGRRSRIAGYASREEATERARRELLAYPTGLLRVHDQDLAVREEFTAEALAGTPPR